MNIIKRIFPDRYSILCIRPHIYYWALSTETTMRNEDSKWIVKEKTLPSFFICLSFHLVVYVLAQTFLSRHYAQNIFLFFIAMVKLYNTIEIRALFFVYRPRFRWIRLGTILFFLWAVIK